MDILKARECVKMKLFEMIEIFRFLVADILLKHITNVIGVLWKTKSNILK